LVDDNMKRKDKPVAKVSMKFGDVFVEVEGNSLHEASRTAERLFGKLERKYREGYRQIGCASLVKEYR